MCTHIHMKNVTISIDEALLENARKYAKGHHTTLNNLIRTMLERTVSKGEEGEEMRRFIELTELKAGNSQGQSWTRDELYDV